MRHRVILPLAAALTLGAAGTAPQNANRQTAPAAEPTPAATPAGPRGYLKQEEWPDSLALLPPPPESGSPAFARDEAASRAMTRAPGTPRFRQAASDADLAPEHLLGTFNCASGITISKQTTPATIRLLAHALIDVGLSTYKAKNRYKRVRPFVAHNNATCFPAQEAMLRQDGSYPSGHSAIGWGWALLLTELVPARTDAILQRGRDFGQSRLVCNAHWLSDVEAGRIVASATVARLHADPAFRTDLEAARAELAALPPAPSTPSAACTQEAAALAE